MPDIATDEADAATIISMGFPELEDTEGMEPLDADDHIVKALAEAMRMPDDQSNDHALCDHKLPAIVRGFLACNMGNATETMAITEAGYMPRLYGTYEGERVRVVMVSSMGDIGISRRDVSRGYFKRVSIYDLSDFATEMTPEAPAKRKLATYYAIRDRKGFWVKLGGGNVLASGAPDLHFDAAALRRSVRNHDRLDMLGLKVIPVQVALASPDEVEG